MRHKHKRYKTLSILAACVALATACSTGGQSSSPASSDALQGRGPITFAAGKDDTGMIPKLVDMWNQGHPQEQVRMIELPSSADDQRQQMVQNAETKSDAFTVLYLDNVWTSEFAANRWITELPSSEFDLSKFLKPPAEAATYRGRLYGVPATSDGGMLFYRKDLLDKAGVAPPKTWSELQQDCDKVRALPEAAGVDCYAGQFDKYEGLTVNFSEAVNSAGGVVVDDNGKPNVDTPQAKQGLDFLVNGFHSGVIAKDALTFKETETGRAFSQGKLVFDRHWSNQWSQVNKTDGSSAVAGKVGVVTLPGLNGPGVSSLGGHALAISSFAKNKATAADFIKFYTAEQQQRVNLEQGANAPTLASLYDDPKLQAEFPFLPTLKQAILTAQPRPRVVRYNEVTQAIQDDAYAALIGTKTPDQALADLQSRLNSLITS